MEKTSSRLKRVPDLKVHFHHNKSLKGHSVAQVANKRDGHVGDVAGRKDLWYIYTLYMMVIKKTVQFSLE